MARYFFLMLCVFFPGAVFAQDNLALRKKIIPLRTTRSDVEKLARPVDAWGNVVEYETDNERLEVSYIKQTCVRNGWNVPAGRVVEFRVYPKKRSLMFEKLGGDRDLFETTDDGGTRYLTDSKKGAVYVARSQDPFVEYIVFIPAPTDSALRCKGFPPYDPIGESYAPLQSGEIKDAVAWDAGSLLTTFVRVKDNSLKGFVFVYGVKGYESEVKRVIKKARFVAKHTLSPKIGLVTIKFGGYRDRLEVETFVLPPNYPDATPTPLYPLEAAETGKRPIHNENKRVRRAILRTRTTQ